MFIIHLFLNTHVYYPTISLYSCYYPTIPLYSCYYLTIPLYLCYYPTIPLYSCYYPINLLMCITKFFLNTHVYYSIIPLFSSLLSSHFSIFLFFIQIFLHIHVYYPTFPLFSLLSNHSSLLIILSRLNET